MNSSKIIKTIRSYLRITQEELAVKLGVSRDIIANYENNRSIPPDDVMQHLIKMLVADRNNLIIINVYQMSSKMSHKS